MAYCAILVGVSCIPHGFPVRVGLAWIRYCAKIEDKVFCRFFEIGNLKKMGCVFRIFQKM